MNSKPTIFLLLLFALLAGGLYTNAQSRDTIIQGKDTAQKKKDTILKKTDTVRKKTDTTKRNNRDSGTVPNIISQKPVRKDSSKIPINQQIENNSAIVTGARNVPSPDTLSTRHILNEGDTSAITGLVETSSGSEHLSFNTNRVTARVLAENKFINTKDQGTFFLQELRSFSGKEFTFYLLCILLFILALFKTFYPMYFNNLFRIFFNTSLRQTQLTDQLSQAKFPSFILNIFFTISGGIYIWLLFIHFNRVQSIKSHILLIICILSVAAIYLIKFIILKFTGWLAGIQHTIDNYIFVIFLVNKIMGILLIPFVILLAFSMNDWIPSISIISALFIGLLFLSRYAKSYGALEKKLSINSLHFFIFVVGAEIIPLFIFYKVAVDYLV